MYQYFLGAFGNRSYIRPQYEVTDGDLRDIGENRWEEFPNGGTVSISEFSDSDVDDIRNRLIKFRIDFRKDFSQHYISNNDNSNKFQIKPQYIEELDSKEIVEIIDIDETIEDFLHDKSKRNIRIKHKPNKQILLRNGQICYGPFEFMISDVEELQYSDESFYTLKIIVNSGNIFGYSERDLEQYILEATYTIRRNDRMEFIYNLDDLEKISPIKTIEYYDNDELADFFKKLLAQSKNIDDVSQLREQFLQILNSFSKTDELSKSKVDRIVELIKKSEELREYKIQIVEEYFKNDPNANDDKEQYLATHEELLDSIAKEDIHYDERVKKLKEELENLDKKKYDVEKSIKDGEKKLSDQKAQLGKLEEEAVEKKRQEIENALAEKKEKLESLEKKIREVESKRQQEENVRDAFKSQVNDLKAEMTSITSDINKKITEWAAHNRNSEIINLLVSQLEITENFECLNENNNVRNLVKGYDFEKIQNIVLRKLEEAKRSISTDEVYNYLISIVQNYIVVFAGEPGTGKTSLCKLLAKALGLYEDRFAQVLVERGWTSSKDLIGYYNPLTKEIEETQPYFSKCIRQLDAECKNNVEEAFYIALLDEANLSPIEFYWSNFNHFFDDPSHQEIKYANGKTYSFGDTLRFLATINYDQTTTDLSPRFIDRAWIISMPSVPMDMIINSPSDDTKVKNNTDVISLEDLQKAFGWNNYEDKKINQVTKDRIERIISKMREGGHNVSARSLKSIVHYYLVAEEYMTSKEVALDFAIAQKILPCLNGNGKKYREFLTGLMNICKENQLNRSAGIISRIIDRQEHEFYGFFSL